MVVLLRRFDVSVLIEYLPVFDVFLLSSVESFGKSLVLEEVFSVVESPSKLLDSSDGSNLLLLTGIGVVVFIFVVELV